MRNSIDVSSILSSDDLADYDIISEGPRSLESSIADLGHLERHGADIHEPPASQVAREKLFTPSLSAEDIQAHVQRALVSHGINLLFADDSQRIVKVYVDGTFDKFNAGHALQLRQAKLSFPLVHLIVGVYSDALCEQHKTPVAMPHIERCELLRHCRWVDEVVPDAPWTLDETFLRSRRIDYVAIDEGISIDPACDCDRLKGYDLVKSIRKAIPTRRTTGLAQTRIQPVAKAFEKLKVSESRQGTIKGTPKELYPEERTLEEGRKESSPSAPQTDSPFEEPKVDIFGTGDGA